MYAICRTLKIKKAADIAACDNHCQRIEGRESDRSHINSELTPYNTTARHFVHEDGSPMKLNEVFDDYTKSQDIKIPRKDSVRMVEYLFTVSPQYFEGCDRTKGLEDEKIKTFADGAIHFLSNEEHTTCLNWHLHLDESTPHIHAHCIITSESKNGTIVNASMVLDGKKKLSALQDRYFETMSSYIDGIKRGLSSDITRTSHVTIKEFRAAINQLKNSGFDAEMVNNISHKLIKNPDKGLESAIAEAENDPEIFRQRAEELRKNPPRTNEKGFYRRTEL